MYIKKYSFHVPKTKKKTLSTDTGTFIQNIFQKYLINWAYFTKFTKNPFLTAQKQTEYDLHNRIVEHFITFSVIKMLRKRALTI